MTSRPPHVEVILYVLAAFLALPVLSHAKCELKKQGGLFSTESFVDSDADKTIKVKIDGLLDPKVSVTYDNKTKVISYTDYTNAVRDCGNS